MRRGNRWLIRRQGYYSVSPVVMENGRWISILIDAIKSRMLAIAS